MSLDERESPNAHRWGGRDSALMPQGSYPQAADGKGRPAHAVGTMPAKGLVVLAAAGVVLAVW